VDERVRRILTKLDAVAARPGTPAEGEAAAARAKAIRAKYSGNPVDDHDLARLKARQAAALDAAIAAQREAIRQQMDVQAAVIRKSMEEVRKELDKIREEVERQQAAAASVPPSVFADTPSWFRWHFGKDKR